MKGPALPLSPHTLTALFPRTHPTCSICVPATNGSFAPRHCRLVVPQPFTIQYQQLVTIQYACTDCQADPVTAAVLMATTSFTHSGNSNKKRQQLVTETNTYYPSSKTGVITVRAPLSPSHFRPGYQMVFLLQVSPRLETCRWRPCVSLCRHCSNLGPAGVDGF